MKALLILAAIVAAAPAMAEINSSQMGLVMMEASAGADMGVDAIWIETAPREVTIIVKRTASPPIVDDFDEGDNPVKRMGNPLRIQMDVLSEGVSLSSSSSVRSCSMHAVMAIEGLVDVYGDAPKIELDYEIAQQAFATEIKEISFSQEGLQIGVISDKEQLQVLNKRFTAWASGLPVEGRLIKGLPDQQPTEGDQE